MQIELYCLQFTYILQLYASFQFSYKGAQCQLNSLHQGWKRVLVNKSEDGNHITAVKQLESAVSLYLKKASPAHDPKDIIAVSVGGRDSVLCVCVCVCVCDIRDMIFQRHRH